MSLAQLGDDNLLIVPGTTDGVLEVEADHLALVLDKQLKTLGTWGLMRIECVYLQTAGSIE